jgi:hypothetical protein
MAAEYMGYSVALALALETSTARVSSALAICRADEAAWIFARPDGEPWHNDDYRNWRKRGFVPAAKEAPSKNRVHTTCATRSHRC